MKISEVIAELKAKSEAAPVRDEKVVNPEWEKAKSYLDTWGTDFSSTLEKNARKVFTSKVGKSTRMSLRMGTIDGHEVELIVYEGDKTTAFYSMFNNKTNTAYVRYLMD